MRVVREMNDVRRVDTDSRTDLARKNPDIIFWLLYCVSGKCVWTRKMDFTQ